METDTWMNEPTASESLPARSARSEMYFKYYLLLNEDCCKKNHVSSLNYPRIFLKYMFDYCFENGIDLPGLDKSSIDELFSDHKDILDKDYSLFGKLKELGLDVASLNNILNRQGISSDYHYLYEKVHSLLTHLVLNHMYNRRVPLENIQEDLMNFLNNRFRNINEFLKNKKPKTSKKSSLVDEDPDDLYGKIAVFEKYLESKISYNMVTFYNWLSQFVQKNYPYYLSIKNVIGNFDEFVVINHLIDQERKKGSSVKIKGKILNIVSYTSTTTLTSSGYFQIVEILGEDNQLYSFTHSKYSRYNDIYHKNKNTEEKSPKYYISDVVDQGYTGKEISLRARVKKVIPHHIYRVPVCCLNYVKITEW
jgi:hypothetical protein